MFMISPKFHHYIVIVMDIELQAVVVVVVWLLVLLLLLWRLVLRAVVAHGAAGTPFAAAAFCTPATVPISAALVASDL